MFNLFCGITTFEFLFIAAFGFISSTDFSFSNLDLIKVPFVALMSTLPVLVLYTKKEPSKREFYVRSTIHFILTPVLW
jgi:hypothetical protein